eukprot:scaffold5006_cov20-Cyclotella_meneghiniana.AAC.1
MDADYDTVITESIIQSLGSIDGSSIRTIQENDKFDNHIIISPKTRLGFTFYYHSKLNPVLAKVINNANPAQLARVVFEMCHHFHIGPLYWDDPDPYAIDSSEQTMISITKLMSKINIDKISQCASGVWRNKSIVGGGGGGGGEDPDDGGDGDDEDNAPFDDEFDEDEDDKEEDADNIDKDDIPKKATVKDLCFMGNIGNYILKCIDAVTTFRSFLQLTAEANRNTLEAAKVEVREITHAAHTGKHTDPFSRTEIEELRDNLIERRNTIRQNYNYIKSKIQEANEAIMNLKNNIHSKQSDNKSAHESSDNVTIHPSIASNQAQMKLNASKLNSSGQTRETATVPQPHSTNVAATSSLYFDVYHQQSLLMIDHSIAHILDVQSFVERTYLANAESPTTTPRLVEGGIPIGEGPLLQFMDECNKHCISVADDPTLRPPVWKEDLVNVRSSWLRQTRKVTDRFSDDNYDKKGRLKGGNVKHISSDHLKAPTKDERSARAVGALTPQQSKPTQNTMDKSQHFLDYMATQEPAVLTYRKSNMILAVHSDAGYLNEENARSRAGGTPLPI